MGMIYESHGKVAVEGRSESFIVHAGYGYAPQRKAVRELALGTWFIHPDGTRVRLHGLRFEGPATIMREGKDAADAEWFDADLEVVWCEESGEPNTEALTDTPLGRLWREVPHPEFEIADLDDLIAALEAYREAKRG